MEVNSQNERISLSLSSQLRSCAHKNILCNNVQAPGHQMRQMRQLRASKDVEVVELVNQRCVQMRCRPAQGGARISILKGDGYTCTGSHVHRSTRVRRIVANEGNFFLQFYHKFQFFHKIQFYHKFELPSTLRYSFTTHRHCSPGVPLLLRAPPPSCQAAAC